MDNSTPQGQLTAHDTYILPRNDLEQKRLNVQHEYLTEVLGGRLIVVDDIQVGPGSRVLDSGTGAGSWILALSKDVPESVELVGIDISGAMFPKDIPSNIKLYEMSAASLPKEWTDTFDLVHQRLLKVALTVPLWKENLSELFRILKPGGAIQLMEFFKLDSVKPESFPATAKMAEILTGVAKKRDLLYHTSNDLFLKLIQEAGFSDIRLQQYRAPYGEPWGEIGVIGARSAEMAFKNIITLSVEEGLGFYESLDEVDDLMMRLKKEWDESPGAFSTFYTVTGKKPA